MRGIAENCRMQKLIDLLGMELERARENEDMAGDRMFSEGYSAGIKDAIKWALEMNPECSPPATNEFVASGCEQFAAA